MGVGVVFSVAWFTGCGGSSPTGGGGSQTESTCAAIAGVYSESGGSCDAGFTCELDGATCVASCSDGSNVTVTPTTEGFSYSSDDGNCKASVSGQSFSGTCAKGIRICSIEGGFTKAPTNGSGGSSSGGSSSGGSDSGGSSTGGSASGGSSSGGTGAGGTGGTGTGATGGVLTYACTGGPTIPLELVCDGISHCPLDDDELDCGNDCGSTECYTCDGGTLIAAEYVCDGDYDCPSLDDEADCEVVYQCPSGGTYTEDQECDGVSAQCDLSEDENSCGGEYYFCHYQGGVIPVEYVCDGTTNCVEGDDEYDCTYFYCDDNEIISASKECDGVEDCFYGEDEWCSEL